MKYSTLFIEAYRPIISWEPSKEPVKSDNYWIRIQFLVDKIEKPGYSACKSGIKVFDEPLVRTDNKGNCYPVRIATQTSDSLHVIVKENAGRLLDCDLSDFVYSYMYESELLLSD